MFTRQHYIEVARILSEVRDPHEKQRLAEEFARMFRQDNPQFDAERFSSAVFQAHTPRRRSTARESRRSYSMTYGTLPPFDEFIRDIRRPDPDYDDGRAYWPDGTTYPMELVDSHEVDLADEFGGLRPFASRYSHKAGYKGDERSIYDFLTFLTDKWNEGDEAAGDLASSIMTTLGYEWV